MKSDHFQCNGYTEYLRHYYNKELTMNFVSIDENVLLLTDHISIQEVSPKLTKEYILSQIKVSLSQFLHALGDSLPSCRLDWIFFKR